MSVFNFTDVASRNGPLVVMGVLPLGVSTRMFASAAVRSMLVAVLVSTRSNTERVKRAAWCRQYNTSLPLSPAVVLAICAQTIATAHQGGWR